jgi:glucose-6-phosphate isomerase
MSNLGLYIEDTSFTTAGIQKEAELLKLVKGRIKNWKMGNIPPFMALPGDKNCLKITQKWRKKICKRANQLIVFGIGGSSLGGEMLVNGLKTKAGLPVKFYDNVDPNTLTSLAKVDWRKTFLLVVSKSGGTAETLSQFLTTLPAMQSRLGSGFNQHVAVITENRRSDLGKIAKLLNIPIIKHPAVGGRFSALSIVGLLPAAVAGVDIAGLLKGANSMLRRCLLTDLDENPALKGATSQYLMAQNAKNISVYLSYGQKLDRVAAWQSQLLGESLGKTDNMGDSHGLTPVAARGVTDQHSQLQLYLDGPNDKQFTLFYDPKSGSLGKRIHKKFSKKFKKLSSVAPLIGHSTGELFKAEFLGTRDALSNRDLPVRTFNIGSGDAVAFGEMIILLESETVIMAEFLGIDAYDQPAVEDSKTRARVYLAQERIS